MSEYSHLPGPLPPAPMGRRQARRGQGETWVQFSWGLKFTQFGALSKEKNTNLEKQKLGMKVNVYLE